MTAFTDAGAPDPRGRLMLLDTAALYFRAFYGVPDTVRAPDGMPVNAVRGLLDIIARLVTEFQPSRLVACWDDDWRPQWRVDLIPSYKTHRVAVEVEVGADVEVVPDPLTPQVPIIREVLAALGIPIIGAPEAEADDVIGTLAAISDPPVDVVTGDRDLFQVIDDSRDVRVIYTGGGMANLQVLTDATIVEKYGIHAAQYVDFAVMRGDPSDGLPGVAGVGEKSAAALLGAHRDLDGIVSAAADAGSAMAAGVRAKLLAAATYLEVAPTVVRVVPDLELPEFDGRIGEFSAAQVAELDRLSAAWNLGGSMERVRSALARSG